MKRLALVFAGVLLSSLTAVTPAHADTPGCVTKAEFRKVHKGMKMRRVHRIFDTKGQPAAFTTSITRIYSPCKAMGSVTVKYRSNHRVKSKSGQWIST